MSEYLRALILGIIQGLAEFLPISSSGHLELAKYFLGDNSSAQDSLEMTVILHIATALATCFIYRKEIFKIISGIFTRHNNEEKQFSIKIIISMIPAAIVGIFFEDIIDTMFDGKVLFVSSMLMLTGILLFFSQRIHNEDNEINYTKAFIIGISQAIAITPGISRSGSTIATALMLNISRQEAAKFSFLMVVPLIFGKICKDLLFGDFGMNSYSPMAILIGFIAAFITGLIACSWMIEIVKKLKLQYFAYYCILVGSIFVIYFLLIQNV